MKAWTLVTPLVVAALGCGDGPTAPMTPTPAAGAFPTPTPFPTGNVSGSWKGKFQGKGLVCDGRSALASAELSQVGAAVRGTLTTQPCGPTGTIEGTLQEGFFRVSLRSAHGGSSTR